ncbi:hypothetical protein [Arthrobacter sp. NPDC090010]|uniref:hypothetical protein n=1 Tax=Arthrobacter sp. NPDC090010 TaxID=3363942 RepID=UPI0038195E73
MSLNEIVLSILFTLIFFYLLYFTVRSAVRDGIKLAREKQENTPETARAED